MRFIINGKQVEPECPVYPDDTIAAIHAKLNVGPVYLYAKKRVRLTTRELYAMFDAPVISRNDVAAMLGNLRFLNKPTYTYNDLVEMNVDDRLLSEFQFPVAKNDLRGILTSLQVSRDLPLDGYTYNDLLELDLDGTYDSYISLGQKTPPDAPVKPGDYDGAGEAVSEKNRVLLEYLPLLNDTIYGTTVDYGKAYLLGSANTRFYNLDAVRAPTIQFEVAVSEIRCKMTTQFNRRIPLEYAFRLLHATERMPLLRYNAVEPLCRVYAPVKDASGQKIPATSAVFPKMHGDGALTCLLAPDVSATFYVNGEYEVQAQWPKAVPIDRVGEMLQGLVDPFLAELNSLLEWGIPSAKATEIYFPPFQLADSKVLNSKVDMATRDTMESFDLDDSELRYVFRQDGDTLFYKRISNFNIQDSALQILRDEGSDALPSLIRLGLTEGDALKAIQTYETSTRRAVKQGIPIEVVKKTTGTLFRLRNVDHLAYLDEIQLYLGALVRPAQADYVSEEESDGSDQSGGGGDDENRRLSNDFFALTRLKSRAAATNKTSKQCLKDKMPIAFTEEEYEAIESDPTNPDPFNLVMSPDGTVLNKPLHHNGAYFACPRYWDMAHSVMKADGTTFLGAPMSEKRFREESHADRLITSTDERLGYAREGKDIYEFVKLHDNTASARKYVLKSDPAYELDSSYGWMTAAVSKKNPMPCCYFPSHVPKDKAPKPPARAQTAQTGVLKVGSRGALPTSVQLFLGNSSWYRYGVEQDDNPFLACLAMFRDASVSETKAALVDVVRRKFKTLQNGNLRYHFATDLSNQFLARSPKQNCLHYLMTGTMIDYTFLWDAVTHEFGNLVIFNGDVNDSTRVELICPTNYFSQKKFDPEKFTIMMLKQGHNYEPIWQDKNGVVKHFKKSQFLGKIQHIYESSCTPYRAYTTLARVLELGLVPTAQLVHNHKTVGVVVDKCHIPCYPSSVRDDLPVDTVRPRTTAFTALQALESAAKRGVVCAPRYQVTKDDTCIGLVVESGQFVPCTRSSLLDLPRYDDIDAGFQPEFEYAELGEPMRRVSARVAEARLYAAARTVVRLSLTAAHRERIQAILDDDRPKSRRFQKLVERVLLPKVEFHDSMPEELVGKLNWSTGKDKRLNLLRTNLVTGHENNYVVRIAEELERFPHQRANLLNQQTIVDHVAYDILETELLISESQWTRYSKTAEKRSTKYVLNTYDSIVSASQSRKFKVEIVDKTILSLG